LDDNAVVKIDQKEHEDEATETNKIEENLVKNTSKKKLYSKHLSNYSYVHILK